MYERLELGLGVEESEGSRVCEIRVARSEHGDVTAPDLKPFRDVDGRGASRLHARRVTRVRKERDLARPRLVEPGGGLNLNVVKLLFGARARQSCKLAQS